MAARVQALKEVEHKGDSVTRTAFQRLHQQFITPFDRTQIHSLLSRIDDVLDFTNAAAARLHAYDIQSSHQVEGDLRPHRDRHRQVPRCGQRHRGRGPGALLTRA